MKAIQINMENIILRYLNNEADAGEKSQLLDWLKEDESNKKVFLDTCNIWLASGNIQISEEEQNNAFERLSASIDSYEKENRQNKSAFRIPLRRAVAVAAIFIIAFSIAGFLVGKRYSAPNTESLIVNNIVIGQDKKEIVTLPDGTSVWINSNSKLTYPDRFLGDTRLVRLEGEAFFNVTKDENKPFIVESEDMKVKVLGTEFDFKNYKNQKNIETSLLSGEVEVFFENVKESIILKPSQRITFNKDSKTFDIKDFDVTQQTIWINNELTFSNERLSDILTKIGYWYGTEVICEGNINPDQKLSFTIRNESKEELFKTISLIAPIRYEISEEKIVVRPK